MKTCDQRKAIRKRRIIEIQKHRSARNTKPQSTQAHKKLQDRSEDTEINARMQKCRSAEVQKYRNTEIQKYKNMEAKTWRRMERKRETDRIWTVRGSRAKETHFLKGRSK